MTYQGRDIVFTSHRKVVQPSNEKIPHKPYRECNIKELNNCVKKISDQTEIIIYQIFQLNTDTEIIYITFSKDFLQFQIGFCLHTEYKCNMVYTQHLFQHSLLVKSQVIHVYNKPVVTIGTFVRFLRLVNPQMALQVRLPGELFGTHCTFKQDLCWHMHHFHMHLQDILVLL